MDTSSEVHLRMLYNLKKHISVPFLKTSVKACLSIYGTDMTEGYGFSNKITIKTRGIVNLLHEKCALLPHASIAVPRKEQCPLVQVRLSCHSLFIWAKTTLSVTYIMEV